MKKTKKHIGYRPTWAEINLDNLGFNFQQVKKIIRPEVKVMVTVKADAYGHGLIPVAKKLVSLGVDYLGVASIDEGITLRKSGIRTPVLVLGAVLKSDIAPLFKYRLAATICDHEVIRALNSKGKSLNQKINVHVKVDTGMGRLGVLPEDSRALIERIRCLKYINIEGVFTHFAFADMDRDFTLGQVNSFNRVLEKLSDRGINVPLVHAANSMGLAEYKNSHFNMVRPGLIIYGLSPRDDFKIRLKPVLSLKTRIVFFKKVPRGFGISYGHEYITKNNTTVVALPIGYGDGYPRNLTNKGPVLIRGKRFKISGRVCMDQVMVDVGDTPVKIGDEAVLIGCQGQNKITSEELASLSGTIPYEIVCGLGSRIPRVYTKRSV